MARSQQKSNRKASGGRYHTSRSKRKSELAGFPANTKLADKDKPRAKRILGGNVKRSLLTVQTISVTDKKGKASKTEIVNVLENPANPHLVRRNIITKGAIVETKLGKARITSRPGQGSVVSGVLL
tara:strand:+ start:156 stop:533 length:378 start_codon:yes stop_codon:yes gene_type:complete